MLLSLLYIFVTPSPGIKGVALLVATAVARVQRWVVRGASRTFGLAWPSTLQKHGFFGPICDCAWLAVLGALEAQPAASSTDCDPVVALLGTASPSASARTYLLGWVFCLCFPLPLLVLWVRCTSSRSASLGARGARHRVTSALSPVVAVCCVLLFFAMVWRSFVFMRRYAGPLHCALHVCLTACLAPLFLFYYLSTAMCNPGDTRSEQYTSLVAAAQKQGLVDGAFQITSMGCAAGWSLCERSRAVKPPRSHFCSIRERVVLQMDHHCVWVGNTVGLLNYSSFLKTLVFLVLGSLLGLGECAALLAWHASSYEVRMWLGFFLASASGGCYLFWWHTKYCVLPGRTTLEVPVHRLSPGRSQPRRGKLLDRIQARLGSAPARSLSSRYWTLSGRIGSMRRCLRVLLVPVTVVSSGRSPSASWSMCSRFPLRLIRHSQPSAH